MTDDSFRPVLVSDNDFDTVEPGTDNDWDGMDWTDYLDGDTDGD